MKTKAYFYIITAAVCWGLIGLFVRTLAAHGFSSMQMVALRSLAAAICVTLPLLRSERAALRIRLRDLWLFVGTGICSLVFFNYCYFNAMQQTSLAVAALLLYTAPVFVMLMSLLCFGEAFTRTKALALLLTFSGCACVTGVFGSSLTLTLSGLLYGLGSGFGYALYSIFGRYALAKYEPLTVTAWTFIIASSGLLPFCHFGMILSLAAAVPYTGLLFALLGLMSTALPFGLYTMGLKHMEAGRASILASVEPLTSTVVGIAIFHEALTLTGAAGMACILGAVILLARSGSANG